MIFIIFLIAMFLILASITKFGLIIVMGDLLSNIFIKILNKPYKRKHYNFCGAERIALTKVDKYCSKKYQKKFNKMS